MNKYLEQHIETHSVIDHNEVEKVVSQSESWHFNAAGLSIRQRLDNILEKYSSRALNYKLGGLLFALLGSLLLTPLVRTSKDFDLMVGMALFVVTVIVFSAIYLYWLRERAILAPLYHEVAFFYRQEDREWFQAFSQVDDWLSAKVGLYCVRSESYPRPAGLQRNH